ncbi:ISAs1 family transposase [Mucilaginibacter sp. HMF7410]|uniref:ISAs1 family transposase n=1 Tax=Mucilaginibacter arboris TaxID=2682090 RepID=A0A7K1SVY4_9SPHI|nr:ISAs1 family transposase [Mucilaginibacter arboris]
MGQLRVYEKSNEITAIPDLLKSLFIEDCLVSVDAMGCQHSIADAIVDKQCDYLLAVKGNQGGLQENVLDSFRFALAMHQLPFLFYPLKRYVC